MKQLKIYFIKYLITLYFLRYIQSKTCPSLTQNYNPMYDAGYVVRSFFKIPYTNVLVINTYIKGSENQSVVYYNDMSTPAGEIINVILPEYTIIDIIYLYTQNNLLAMNYDKIIIANPYTLKSEKQLSMKRLVHIQLLEKTYFLIATLKYNIINIIHTDDLSVYKTLDNSKFPDTFNTFNFYTKYFTRPLPMQYLLITVSSYGFYSWTFDFFSKDVKYNGYIWPTVVNNTDYANRQFTKHLTKDIFFVGGANLEILAFEIVNLITQTYRTQMKLNLYNSQYKLNVTNIVYKINQNNPFLIINDGYYIYDLYLSFDDVNKIITIPTYKAPPYYTDKFNTSYTWYEIPDDVEYRLIMSSNYFVTFYNYYTHTYTYNLFFGTDWQSRRFMYEGNNGISYFVILKEKSIQYYNRTNLAIRQGSTSNITFKPYYEVNNFYRVKNCEECLLIKTAENDTNNNFISQVIMYPLINNLNTSLNISSLGFKWSEVNLNLDPFYYQNQTWIVFGYRNKPSDKKFLFTMINMQNITQNVNLYGSTDEENSRPSSYSIASVDDPENLEIIGVDLLGYIYVWDFLSPQMIKYTRISNQSCLNSDIGTLYQQNKKKWLIYACDDMWILSYDFQKDSTQQIRQVAANPLSLRAFPSAGIVVIGDTITGNAYIYKFNNGLFIFFLTIQQGSLKDRVMSIELLKDNTIWIQYSYSNLLYSLGDCIDNVKDCYSCEISQYFNYTSSSQTYGSGSITNPYISSSNFITAMLGAQKYYDRINGITTINVNIIIDPSFKLVLYKQFLNFYYSPIVQLTIKSRVVNQFALLENTDQLEFKNYNYVRLEDIKIQYFFSIKPQQCGVSFQNITKNVTLNNIYLFNLSTTISPLNCFQIVSNKANVQILKLSIQNLDFSYHNSIISTLQTDWINIQNLSLENCILGDKFSLLTQNSNLIATMRSVKVTNNKCSLQQSGASSSLFSAGLFNVEDLNITNNNFCNKIIFSSVPSLDQQNYQFQFKQILVFNNNFTTKNSYLFFNSFYSMKQLPSHSTTFLQMNFQNNTLKQIKSDDLIKSSFIQTSKIMNHIFEDVIFKNHHEISFSSIEYSNNVQIKKFDCINDKEYFDKSPNSTSGNCFKLYEIMNTKIQTIRINYKKAYNSQLISLKNKLYHNLSYFDILDGQFSNLILLQYTVNYFANTLNFYSQNNLTLTISNCSFFDNSLEVVQDTQTFSTNAIWVGNTLGQVNISDSAFRNSTSNSTYNFMFIETYSLELNNIKCNGSSFFGLSSTQQRGGFMNLRINNMKMVDSSFSKSKSQYGSFIFINSYEQILKVSIINTYFSGGYAHFDGGALYFDIFKSELQFKCIDCFFDNIYTYSSKSSAIGFQKQRITSDSLIHQMSYEGGRIQNIFGVEDNFFTDVQNMKLSLINIKQIKKFIDDSEISDIPENKQFNEIASQQSTLVNSEYSEVNIIGCNINNISILNPDSNFSLLINSQFTKIRIFDTTIQDGIFVRSLIKIANGTLSIRNTQFKNIVQQKKNSTRLLSDYDQNLRKDDISSLIILRDSNLVISEKTAFLDTKCYNNCTGAVFYLMNTKFDITGMIISNSEAQYGGSLFILGLKHLNKVISSKFENNIAYFDGGAVYLQALKDDSFTLEIENCEFLSNNALSGDGGALFIRSKSQNSTNQLIQIKDTNLIGNIAQIGGGVNEKEISSKLLGNNIFKLNVGKKFGNDSLSYPSRLRLVSMDQFHDKYKAENIGNDTLLITNFRSGDTLKSLEFELINDQDEIIRPINTQEIQEFAVRVRVRNNENFENYSIRKNNIAYYDINSKKFVFKEFDFIGIPGSQATLEFVSDQIYVLDKNKINQYNQDYAFKIIVNLRDCVLGEAIKEYNSLTECIICPEGRYSLDFKECYVCPTGATCYGGSQMIANQGYWRKASDSSEFISCSLFENCNGGVFGDHICFEGHIGALCEECDISGAYWKKNYSKSAKNSCTNCDKISHNSWFVSLLTLWTLISMALAIKGDIQIRSQQGSYSHNFRGQFKQQMNSTQNPLNQMSQSNNSHNNSEMFKSVRSKNQSLIKSMNSSSLFSPKHETKSIQLSRFNEKNMTLSKNVSSIKKLKKKINQEEERSSVYIKILTNYFQIVSSIATFNLSIPSGIFEFPQSVGSPLKSTLNSLDCVLKDYKSSIPYIYLRLMFSLLIPVGYFLIFFLSLVFFKINNIKARFPWYILFTAIMFLIIYVQPDLVAQMIALISCRQIGDTKYILADVSYECYTSEHSKYVLLFISPLLTIWVLVLPLILFYMLYQNRNNLSKIKIKLRYGFLYKEYKKEAFYWEFIKMVEKMLIILSLNFYSTNVVIKAVLVFVIIVLYGILSIIIEPFEENNINQLDIFSTNVCALTVLFGLFIYKNPFSYFLYPSLGLIILINSFFILTVLKRIINSYVKRLQKILQAYIKKLAQKHPQLMQYLSKQEDIKKVDPRVKEKIQKVFEYYLSLSPEEKQKTKIRILKSEFNETLLNMYGDQSGILGSDANQKSLSLRKKFQLFNSDDQNSIRSQSPNFNRLHRPIKNLNHVNEVEGTQNKRAFARFTILSEFNQTDEIIDRCLDSEQYEGFTLSNKESLNNSTSSLQKEIIYLNTKNNSKIYDDLMHVKVIKDISPSYNEEVLINDEDQQQKRAEIRLKVLNDINLEDKTTETSQQQEQYDIHTEDSNINIESNKYQSKQIKFLNNLNNDIVYQDEIQDNLENEKL